MDVQDLTQIDTEKWDRVRDTVKSLGMLIQAYITHTNSHFPQGSVQEVYDLEHRVTNALYELLESKNEEQNE